MTLQQLEYVLAVDQHRHFTTAAEACFVTQPTLSVAIKKLEEEIGVILFDRQSKPIAPTPAGEQIIIKMRQILHEVDQLKAWVSSETESLQGTYTLGVIPTLAPYILPLFVQSFSERFPGTHLVIREMQTAQIIEGLKTGKVDIGLLVTPLEDASIREVPVYYEPFLIYAQPDHPLMEDSSLTPGTLPPSDMLVLGEGHCFRSQMLAICERPSVGAQHRFEYESGSIEALKAFVQRGVGYTLVPELAIDTAKDATYSRRFADPQPVREVSLAVHRSFTREAVLENLRAAIADAVPDRFQLAAQYTRVKWR